MFHLRDYFLKFINQKNTKHKNIMQTVHLKRIIVLLIFGLLGVGVNHFIYAQSANLVENPSFEEYETCPKTYSPQDGSHKLIPNWGYPTLGAADYFHKCGINDAHVPDNFAGVSQPKSGKAYAGFFSTGDDKDYREYLQGILKEPLQAGKKYCIRYSFKLASLSYYACDQMGMYFSNTKVENMKREALKLNPQIKNPEGYFLDNIDEWEEVCEIYTAKGGEQYIILGNFKNDENTNYIAIDRNLGKERKSQAYYYIDDVYVVPLNDCKDCPCVAKDMEAVFVDTFYTGGRDPITGKVDKIINDGKIRISVSGGTPPYNIKWSNGSTSTLLTNLSAGTYTYSVIDQNNCNATGTVTFVEPEIETDEFLDGLRNIEEGSAIVLKNIFFDFGKTDLLPASYAELDKVVAYMLENKIKMIEISGHTDNKGSDASNTTLSQDRANAVVSYLVSKGVSPSTMTAKGYGESKPIDTNETEEGRAQNRRVEFKLIKK